jgi:hypothetical protein
MPIRAGSQRCSRSASHSWRDADVRTARVDHRRKRRAHDQLLDEGGGCVDDEQPPDVRIGEALGDRGVLEASSRGIDSVHDPENARGPRQQSCQVRF